MDILLGRLIENEKTDFVGKLVAKYFRLYMYHEGPALFIADLLFYYFDSPGLQVGDCKIKLLKLLESSSITFSSYFTQYFTSKNTNLFTNQYFKQVIARLASIISTTYSVLPSQQQRPSQTLFHTFNEFPTTTQRTLTSVILELLVLPLPPQAISAQLVNVIFETQLRSFSTMSSVGLIVASLPVHFHRYLYHKAASMLKQDPLLLPLTPDNNQAPALGPFSLFFAADYSSNVLSFIDNRANKILVLLQLFFHYSSIENLNILPRFISDIRPLVSLQQLFFLCKLTGPFIYRLSSNTNLFPDIIGELFQGLGDLSSMIHSTSCYTLAPPLQPNSPLSLLEIIIDFFYHCKHAFPKLAPLFAQKVKGTITKMCPELQDKLKHFV
jgi:hypothetical protein